MIHIYSNYEFDNLLPIFFCMLSILSVAFYYYNCPVYAMFVDAVTNAIITDSGDNGVAIILFLLIVLLF